MEAIELDEEWLITPRHQNSALIDMWKLAGELGYQARYKVPPSDFSSKVEELCGLVLGYLPEYIEGPYIGS